MWPVSEDETPHRFRCETAAVTRFDTE